jgi:hypothetical protein
VEAEGEGMIPSMGGDEIGRLLYEYAYNVKTGCAIVELGCWLGAGTIHLARGVRDSYRGVKIHAYDNFKAGKSQIDKADKFGVELDGKNNLTIFHGYLASGDVADYVIPHKGDIKKATWTNKPIGLHIDYACKRKAAFDKAIETFSPAWIAGETIVVLMDYWYFQRPGKDNGLKYQYDWMRRHKKHFEVVVDRLHKRVPGAAFRYLGGLT